MRVESLDPADVAEGDEVTVTDGVSGNTLRGNCCLTRDGLGIAAFGTVVIVARYNRDHRLRMLPHLRLAAWQPSLGLFG